MPHRLWAETGVASEPELVPEPWDLVGLGVMLCWPVLSCWHACCRSFSSSRVLGGALGSSMLPGIRGHWGLWHAAGDRAGCVTN